MLLLTPLAKITFFATKSSIIQLLKVFAASVVIMGISVVVGKVVGGKSGISMVALILTITTLSLLMTGSKQVRSWDKSYDAGMYLIYVFCLVMATMAAPSTTVSSLTSLPKYTSAAAEIPLAEFPK